VNFAVKSVRAAISNKISGKSTRGSRDATSFRSWTRLTGSSSLSGALRACLKSPGSYQEGWVSFARLWSQG
jgi:hypothetical protein